MSRTGPVRLVTVATTAAFLCSAGCSLVGDDTPAPSTTVVTVTPSRAPTTTTTATATRPTTAYEATSTRVSGSNDHATYDVTIPQLRGGSPAVTAEFNESMQTALQDQIDHDYDQPSFALRDGYARGPFHIGTHVVSAEQITGWTAVPPGAHGDSLLATVTINTDTAAPVTLQDAFADLGTGLARLSQESSRILPTTVVGDGFVRDGIAPTTSNFANWTASPAGMQIHFGDYQVGAYAAGLVTITVPWANLSDVLAPGMQAVLSS